MPRYAAFDPFAPEPAPVIGWYDTGLLDYPSLPDPSALIEVDNGAVWAERTARPWHVSGGALVPAAPLERTLAQRAGDLLAGGLTVTSAGTPEISGVYACDPASRAAIAEIVAGINAGHGFPGGGESFDFGLMRVGVAEFHSETLFLAVAIRVRDFVYLCNQVIAGRSDVLPEASASVE